MHIEIVWNIHNLPFSAFETELLYDVYIRICLFIFAAVIMASDYPNPYENTTYQPYQDPYAQTTYTNYTPISYEESSYSTVTTTKASSEDNYGSEDSYGSYTETYSSSSYTEQSSRNNEQEDRDR